MPPSPSVERRTRRTAAERTGGMIGESHPLALAFAGGIAAVIAVAICVAATWPRWHGNGTLVPLAAPVSASATIAASAATTLASQTIPSGTTQTTQTTQAQATQAAQASSNTAAPTAPTSLSMHAASGASPATAPTSVLSTGIDGASGVPVPATRNPHAASVRKLDMSTDAVGAWSQLNEHQRTALAPFEAVWPQLSAAQQRKWIAVAGVFPRMSADAQQRLHERMLRWASMSADERRLARENYELSRTLAPGARQQAWRAYQALPEAQKQKLAAAERQHHRALVVSAPPTAHSALRHHPVVKPERGQDGRVASAPLAGSATSTAVVSGATQAPLRGAANTSSTSDTRKDITPPVARSSSTNSSNTNDRDTSDSRP